MTSVTHIRAAIVLVAIVCLAGCSGPGDTKSQIGETAFQPFKKWNASGHVEPLTIRMAVNDTYCKKTACSCVHYLASREYEELQSQLKTKHNIDLELTYYIDEFDLTEALKSHEFDGAICKPWFAFGLVPEYGMHYTRIVDILDPFENQMMKGIFIVLRDSPIKKLSEVTGKRVSIGQPDSFEKYHMPLCIMAEQQIRPEKIINKASCTESISMLLDRSVDVAVVSDYSLIAGCSVDLAKEDDFRIIAETEDIPLCSVIVDRSKITDAVALRLQAALLSHSGDNSLGSMASKGFVKPVKWTPVMFTE